MRRLVTAFCMLTTPAMAQDAPKVVADIAPIRALTAQIMEGVGTPSQIIPSNASPHGYAMRPSEARALGSADLVVWVGPALTHWLEEPIETLASSASHLTLMQVAKTEELPMREAEDMGEHKDHDAHGDGHDDHADDDHEAHKDDHAEHDDDHDNHKDEHADHEEGHDDHESHEEEGHDDHDEVEEAGHDHHHHGTIDPHAWLSPSTAMVWATAIAQQLSEIDPLNAAAYARNLEELKADVAALGVELNEAMAPYKGTNFVVLHDAYQYFEKSFDVTADAFIFAGDSKTPGPATLKALRDHLSEHPAVCAFTAPQENDDLLRTAIEGQGTRVAVLDPIGNGDEPYTTLMRNFANNMVACFEGK